MGDRYPLSPRGVAFMCNRYSLLQLLLPLQKASLEKDIWLQPAHWPDFRGQDVVCRLDAVRVLAARRTQLRAVDVDG